MRTGHIIVALAAQAIAAPYQHKRDLVVVTDVVTDVIWVTAVVTVTASPVYVTEPVSTGPSTSSTGIAGVFNHDVNAAPFDAASTSSTLASITIASSSGSTVINVVSSPTSIAVAASSTSIAVSTPAIIAVAPSSTSSSATSIAYTSVPTTTTTSAAASSSTSTSSSDVTTVASTTAEASSLPTTYNELVVAHHNLHRRNHSAPDIVWDDDLASAAATIASSCNYAHNTAVDSSTIGGYGQNIAAGVDAANISVIITELFYNGEVNWYDGLYGEAQPSMTDFEHWGHFSQIVWNATSKVGCATQTCSVLENVPSDVQPVFTVCNYQTPGNVGGEYTDVGDSLGLPTANWDYYS